MSACVVLTPIRLNSRAAPLPTVPATEVEVCPAATNQSIPTAPMGMSSSAALAARLATSTSGTLVSSAARWCATPEHRLYRDHGDASNVEGSLHIYLKCKMS